MTEHTVKQGECLSSIAEQYGWSADVLWDQNGDLKGKRKDPNVLLPGDVVQIPDKRPRQHDGATEKRHRFRRKGVPAELNVQLVMNGKPRADVPYRLDLDGQMLEARTDGDGWVRHPIPPGAGEGRLTLKPEGEEEEEFLLNLGHLDPPDEVTGCQARLYNQGYYCGGIDGKAGSETRRALKAFQREQGIEPSGEVDQATTDALRKLHLS